MLVKCHSFISVSKAIFVIFINTFVWNETLSSFIIPLSYQVAVRVFGSSCFAEVQQQASPVLHVSALLLSHCLGAQAHSPAVTVAFSPFPRTTGSSKGLCATPWHACPKSCTCIRPSLQILATLQELILETGFSVISYFLWIPIPSEMLENTVFYCWK